MTLNSYEISTRFVLLLKIIKKLVNIEIMLNIINLQNIALICFFSRFGCPNSPGRRPDYLPW
jgi:hypothetical protein